MGFNPLNAKLNPICHLLALLGAHHILHVSGIRVKYHTCESRAGTLRLAELAIQTLTSARHAVVL